MSNLRIDPDRLWRHLQEFSSTVRTSGSAAELQAFRYAEQVLADGGFSVRLLSHKGFISVPGSSRIMISGRELDCICHSMTAATPAAGVSAPLREAEQADLSGHVALASGIAGPGAVLDLERRGAVGAVFVNAEHTYEMCSSPVWGSPDLAGLEQLAGIPVVSVTAGVAVELEAAAAAGAAVTLHTSVQTGWADLPLLEATLDGPNTDGSLVLFSGHVDAWHLGAMDNGGANATMLEVALQLASRPELLRRSLRMLFWSGHSHGRYAGSTWYADNHFEELRERALLHVNIDSVGGRGATVLTHSPCMAETFELGRQAVHGVTGQEYSGARSERAGDQSFYGHGVSSLFMGLSEQPASDDVAGRAFAGLFGGGRTGGFGWWWHTTEDTIDKLDRDNLERDATVYLRALELACHSELPPLNYSATAAELESILSDYGRLAGGLLDFSKALERAADLHEALLQLEEQLQSRPDRESWKLLKAVARILVPLNYVAGSEFGHDPALPQPPLPALQDLHRLAQLATEAERLHLLTGARRALNRVEQGLADALKLVRSAGQ